MPYSNTRSRLLYLLKLLGVAVLYVLLSHVIHIYFKSGTITSVFEPASGLALAALLIGGRKYAWGVLLGSLLINVMTTPLWAAAIIALGNTLEALCGAWLLTRGGSFNPALQSLRDYLRLILLGGGAGVSIGALAGATALLVSGFLASGTYFPNLLHWWMGDALGVILVTPLILVWRHAQSGRPEMKPALEAMLVIGMSFLAGQIIYFGWFHDSVGQLAKDYWMFAWVTLVAVRLGAGGAVVVLAMASVQALLGAYYGVGFFADDIANTHLTNYWFFTVVLSVVGMVLATYITERRQAEAALRESENKLHVMLNQTPAVLWVMDTNFNFTLCQGAGLGALNLASEQLAGLSLYEFLGTRNPENLALVAVHDALLGKESAYDAEQNGVWFQNSVKPLKNERGQIVGVIGASLDITARIKAELAMGRLGKLYRLLGQVNEAIVHARGRNELFATICNAAVESGLFRMVWVGMLDGKEPLVMPVAHAGAEESYLGKLHIRLDDGHTGNGPTGRAIREGVHVIVQDIEHDPIMLPWRDAAMKRGYRASAAFPVREVGCVVGAMNVYAAEAHFFTPDIVKLMLELAEDISFSLEVFAEKKRREQAENVVRQLNLDLEQRVRERTRQLEAANKELEAFSYSVSHDLRAPLRSIDGFSQILSKKYHDQLDATGKDYLERVRRASQRMGHLIDDMLELSQVTRSQFKRRQVDLSEIANNVADDLRKINPGRQVQFTLQQGLSVHADPGLLRIVMDNLLGNAYKYTGKEAEAEIEFGMCGINGESAFFVRDNGVGFNMDYVHKLFGAFQRLHGTNEFEGTGIGLATVQRIIHRHHGKVWAEGKEGQGATFYFTLPQRTLER